MKQFSRRGETVLSARSDRMIGVIDIGSNSLRLVIYDRLSRSPLVLFNEKIMCALGRGLNVTGRLNPAGLKLARENIARFVEIARRLGVQRLDALATAAVRDAADGATFIAEIEAACGLKIMLIDGVREGQLSAAGVRACIPDADGIMGDLGGGSLELAVTGPRASGSVISLPIGPLRLMEESGDDIKPHEIIDSAIASVPFLTLGRKKPFYAVGGTWRALARLQMEQQHYPLHIIQHYEMSLHTAQGFFGLMDHLSRRSLEKMVGISRRRLETMPLAAYTMMKLIEHIQPSSLVFSIYGLREGHLFDQLSAEEQAADPLIIEATQIAGIAPRFGGNNEELCTWLNPVFSPETSADKRLLKAAAILSDIGWTEHPDYRAEHVFLRVLHMPITGLDHAGRVFLAVALQARYGGDFDAPYLTKVAPLLDQNSLIKARTLGMALRLAYTVTAGAPGILAETSLRADAANLTLTLPAGESIFTGEAVQRRLEALGRAMGRKTAIIRTK